MFAKALLDFPVLTCSHFLYTVTSHGTNPLCNWAHPKEGCFLFSFFYCAFSASEAGVVLFGCLVLFFFLELLYCVSQPCQIPLLWMFWNRIPVARTSVSDELPLPGDSQDAQDTDLITGWTFKKDCRIKHEVLEVVSLLGVVVFWCIFSGWMCR